MQNLIVKSSLKYSILEEFYLQTLKLSVYTKRNKKWKI